MEHLRNLLALLEELEPSGIALHSHEYDAISFGAFVVVLAKNHKMARFSWDGRESILTIAYQTVQNQAAAGTWQHDAYISVPREEDVFAEIGSNVEAMLS